MIGSLNAKVNYKIQKLATQHKQNKQTVWITNLYYISAQVINIFHIESNLFSFFRNSTTRFQLQSGEQKLYQPLKTKLQQH